MRRETATSPPGGVCPFEIGLSPDQVTQPHTLMHFLGNVNIRKTEEMLTKADVGATDALPKAGFAKERMPREPLRTLPKGSRASDIPMR